MARSGTGRRAAPLWVALAAASVLASLLASGPARPAVASWGTGGAGSGASESVVLQPARDVVATCMPGMVIRLRWTPSELRTGFAVQRSVAGGPWVTVATASSTDSQWDDTTLVNVLGLALRWRVRDTYLGWTSPPSAASNTRMISLAGVCV